MTENLIHNFFSDHFLHKLSIIQNSRAVINHVGVMKIRSALPSCFSPHNLIRGKVLNSRSDSDSCDFPLIYSRTTHSPSSFRRIFPCCRLSATHEGEEHHRVSFSIGDDSAVDSAERKKKGTRGTPKRDLSSSLTNDRTSNGASRLAPREQRSWYVETETEGRKGLSLSSFLSLPSSPSSPVSIPLKRRRQQRWSENEKVKNLLERKK